MQSRREFLKAAIIGGAGFAVLPWVVEAGTDPWSTLYPQILSRIKPPVFPQKDFEITKFGAKSGGANDSTLAIAKAIEACSTAGGGRVVVPAGEFLTGAVNLRSNVNLYISKEATLKFSTDPKKYPLVRA